MILVSIYSLKPVLLIKPITQLMKSSTCSWFCWSGSHLFIYLFIYLFNLIITAVLFIFPVNLLFKAYPFRWILTLNSSTYQDIPKAQMIPLYDLH